MTKYIRTECGIYETSDEDYKLFMLDSFKLAFKDKYKEEIIAQADTIEELCDDFVVYHKYEDGSEYYGLCRREYEWKHALKDDVIYGAVWCEFGLKYVAKLNEKGDLELI